MFKNRGQEAAAGSLTQGSDNPRMNASVSLSAALSLSLACAAASAQERPDCRSLADDAARLACWDAQSSTPPVVSAPRADTAPKLQPGNLTGALDATWELTPEHKRGTFVVRTYQPTYVLPAVYTNHINNRPHSPTQPVPSNPSDGKHVESQFQVSLRVKVLENFGLPNADLWFAYTQQSLWQVWNPADSAPFRSTDYQPEAFYIVPVPAAWTYLPGGWRWHAVQVGVAHQSNGQRDPLSRSWNRTTFGTLLSRGDLGLSLKYNQRWRESYSDDDNPDLLDYTGQFEATASWLRGYTASSLTWKGTTRDGSRGSLQLDISHPINHHQPDGLRWFVQVFTGYGASLLDYNVRQTRLGLGVLLFQL
ncbi:phospholipase (plasmid) [Vitreoscilla filiformis]|uniref:Phospholipase A1 n=2 Tax=Vitreoscilla filiformis TaxID=63 RepID=A0A221KK16_VITFI|nr:phospholipase [Vitreoscilla filiformis]